MTDTTAPLALSSIDAPLRDILAHRAAAVSPDADDIHSWLRRLATAPGFALTVELNSQISFLASCSKSQPSRNSGICKRLHGLWIAFDRPRAGILAR